MSIIDPAIEYPAHFESDVVLRNGAIPLFTLRRLVTEWANGAK